MKKHLLFWLITSLLIAIILSYTMIISPIIKYPFKESEVNENIIHIIEEFIKPGEENFSIKSIITNSDIDNSNKRVVVFTGNKGNQYDSGHVVLSKGKFNRYKIDFAGSGDREFEYQHINTNLGPYFLIYGETNPNKLQMKLKIDRFDKNSELLPNVTKKIDLSNHKIGDYYFYYGNLPKDTKMSNHSTYSLN